MLIVEGIAALNTDESGVVARQPARRGTLAPCERVVIPGAPSRRERRLSKVLLERTPAPRADRKGIGGDEPQVAPPRPISRAVGKSAWPKKLRPKNPPRCGAIEVVPEDAVPNEGLDVEVDRIGAAEQLDRLLGDSELLCGVGDFHRNGFPNTGGQRSL